LWLPILLELALPKPDEVFEVDQLVEGRREGLGITESIPAHIEEPEFLTRRRQIEGYWGVMQGVSGG